MGQHDRVVVHVHHAGGGGDVLRRLVHVLTGRDAGADIQELADPGPGGENADSPLPERLVGPDGHENSGEILNALLGRFPVGGEMVLAAEPVVIHPGTVRDAGVE